MPILIEHERALLISAAMKQQQKPFTQPQAVLAETKVLALAGGQHTRLFQQFAPEELTMGTHNSAQNNTSS